MKKVFLCFCFDIWIEGLSLNDFLNHVCQINLIWSLSAVRLIVVWVHYKQIILFVRYVFLDISDEYLRRIKIICLDVFEFYLRWNYNLISKKFFLHSYVENLLFTQHLNIIETFFLKHSNISREQRLFLFPFCFFQIFEELS